MPAARSEAPASQAAEPSPAQVQEEIGQAGERVERLKQQSEFLSQQYLAQGDALLDQNDYEGALSQYSQALEVDPDNQAARERMRRVQGLMGEGFAGAAQGIQDAIERETVRRAQARLEAEQLTIDGDNALRAGEYDQAVELYRRALNILRFHPLIADQTLDERVLDGKLQSAVQLAEERDNAERARAELTRVNAQLESANLALREASQTRDEFLAIAAHDLRNPLQAVLGCAESILEQPALDATTRAKASLVYRSSRRMLTLVNQLVEQTPITLLLNCKPPN